MLVEPLAYNQHISGVWGARVLEPSSSDVLQRDHSLADPATLTRVSQARRELAAAVLRRYLAMAAAGYTHFVHLVVVDEAVGRVRVRRYEEMSRRGQSPCMSEARYRDLISCLPLEWVAILDSASALLRTRLDEGKPCGLADLARTYPLAEGVWVRLPSGLVTHVGKMGVIPDTGWAVSPTGRLVAGPDGEDEGWVDRELVEEAIVWSTVWCAHSKADEEQETRRVARAGRGRARDELVYGGVYALPEILGGLSSRVVGAVHAGHWALTYAPTDRTRPCVPFVGVDVSHLYGMQLSRAHVVPRTLREGAVSETSTSWLDALDHPTATPSEIRLAAFGLVSEGELPRWTQECHWRTLIDAWPIGNGRCQKRGDSSQLCEICWRMGHGEGLTRDGMLSQFRETTRHVRLDCPYAMAVIDTVARAVAGVVGAPVSEQRDAADLLREVGAAMVTGFRGTASCGTPFGVVVAELSRVLMERQRHNACGGVLDCCPNAAYQRVRAAVERVLQLSWREAQRQERAILMWLEEVPEEDTPTTRWLKRWAGFYTDVRGSMELAFPATRADVLGGAVPVQEDGVRVLAGLTVCGTHVRLDVRAATALSAQPIGVLSPPACVLTDDAARAPQSAPPEVLRAGVLTVYVDGSGDAAGGWGVVVVEGGRGTLDRHVGARLRAEFYGPLVLDVAAPPFMGADRATNNTAELTALAEGLAYLREVDASTGPALLRPDSEYAIGIATGLSLPTTNRVLAQRVRRMWQDEEERRGGQLWALHVRGHSSNTWNHRADRGAARGALGFVCGVGERWASWPPLPGRVLRAHEVSTAQRVMRAQHAFGVLAVPVPVGGEVVASAHLDTRLACLEHCLQHEHGPQVGTARRRVRAAHRLLSDPARQRTEAERLVAAGLKPVTSELECPINVRAMRSYVQRAGAGADIMQYDKRGKSLGTLREQAQRFLRRLGTRSTVRIAYQHSLLGAELVAAGFVVASREYAQPGQLDPFRLPRALREVAFARRGSDMDDSASYPRACLNVFRAGQAHARQFLSGPNREAILAEVGMHFFGPRVPAKERRKHTKQLFNALDNDGELRGWLVAHDLAVPPPPAFELPDGTVFGLQAYIDSRATLTAEFKMLMPEMNAFVASWLRARDDPRVVTHERTAKSYFLQEAEGLSRWAKVMWARLRGDVRVTNLQHDGVIADLPDGMTVAVAEAQMAVACEAVLGYAQPVERKDLGEGVAGSDASDIDDAGGG